MKDNKKKIIIVSIVVIIIAIVTGVLIYMKYLTRNTNPTPKEFFDQRNYKLVYIKSDHTYDINGKTYNWTGHTFFIADRDGKIIDTRKKATSEAEIVLQSFYYDYSNPAYSNIPPFFSNVELKDGVLSYNTTGYNGKDIEQLIYDYQHSDFYNNVEVIRL